jgi:hypothetical protein
MRPSHRVTGNRRDSVAGPGWEFVQVAIDDHSRIAFSAFYADEKQASVLAFLSAAPAYYPRFGIQFKAVLADDRPIAPMPSPRPAALSALSIASPDPTPTHQWRGITLYPDRTARVGLRRDA